MSRPIIIFAGKSPSGARLSPGGGGYCIPQRAEEFLHVPPVLPEITGPDPTFAVGVDADPVRRRLHAQSNVVRESQYARPSREVHGTAIGVGHFDAPAAQTGDNFGDAARCSVDADRQVEWGHVGMRGHVGIALIIREPADKAHVPSGQKIDRSGRGTGPQKIRRLRPLEWADTLDRTLLQVTI